MQMQVVKGKNGKEWAESDMINNILVYETVYDENGNCDEMGVDPICMVRTKDAAFFSTLMTGFNEERKEVVKKMHENGICGHIEVTTADIKAYLKKMNVKGFDYMVLDITGMEGV